MDTATAPRIEPTNLLTFNLDGSLTVNKQEVAHLLGITSRLFDKIRGDLTGFPRKLPGMERWSRPAVVAWISSNGNTTVPQARGIAVGDPEIEAIVSDLERTYGVAS